MWWVALLHCSSLLHFGSFCYYLLLKTWFEVCHNLRLHLGFSLTNFWGNLSGGGSWRLNKRNVPSIGFSVLLLFLEVIGMAKVIMLMRPFTNLKHRPKISSICGGHFIQQTFSLARRGGPFWKSQMSGHFASLRTFLLYTWWIPAGYHGACFRNNILLVL